MSKGRIKSKRLDFTQVSNKLIFDSNLSNHAKVLGCMIQAKITIPDFILYKTTLIKLFGKQEDTFNKYWRELKENGYLVQFKEIVTKEHIKEHYSDKGIKEEDWPKLGTYYYEYEFLDIPDVAYAKEQNEKNNQFSKINEARKKTEHIEKPKKVKCEKPKKSSVGKKHTVEVPHSGNIPQHNKTDFNNTDLNNTFSSSSEDDEKIIEQYKDYRNIKKLSHEEISLVTKLITEHGEDKVSTSIKQAVAYGGNSYKYLEAIVHNGINTKITNSNKENNILTNKFGGYSGQRTYDPDRMEQLEQEHLERLLSK